MKDLKDYEEAVGLRQARILNRTTKEEARQIYMYCRDRSLESCWHEALEQADAVMDFAAQEPAMDTKKSNNPKGHPLVYRLYALWLLEMASTTMCQISFWVGYAKVPKATAGARIAYELARHQTHAVTVWPLGDPYRGVPNPFQPGAPPQPPVDDEEGM